MLIATCSALVTLIAWLYLTHLHRRMSSQMSMAMSMPWTPADFFFTFVMWAIMMVAMMTGPAAPVLLLFAGAQAKRAERVPLATLLFGLGYFLVWFGFSATAALAQFGLHQAALLSSGMKVLSPNLAGGILVAAGAYQLTPFKGACLTQCRSPLGFLMSHWQDGSWGALRMGLRHGAFCLGCCWALMCVLFLVGVMNLAWVAALTVFVLLEKIGSAGAYIARGGGVVMIGSGILLLAGAL